MLGISSSIRPLSTRHPRCLLALLAPIAAACGGAGAPGAAPPTSSASSDAGSSSGGSIDAASGDGSSPLPASASVTLGFADPSAYILYASIGGGPAHRVQLDTGSLGLYAPKSVLGPSVQVSTTACSITYVSSGNQLSGHEATAPITLLGSSAAGDVPSPPTTVPMTFCAIDDPSFTGGMMGVGFGRGASSDPKRNALLEVADVASGRMRAGYVLSTHPAAHVDIGLGASAKDGFAMVPLTAAPGGSGDWLASSLRGCLAVPSAPSYAAACGPLLVDTGVPECLLWGPADPTLGGAVPAGAKAVPSGVGLRVTTEVGSAILDYAFVVGQGADSPSAVDLRSASAFSINTGRALLVDYDYLFDAAGGAVGFRRAQVLADAGGSD
jgi:hypothetical protein